MIRLLRSTKPHGLSPRQPVIRKPSSSLSPPPPLLAAGKPSSP